MTPPKSPFPHPSLPNGLLWVSSLGTRYQRKRERQGQAGVGRGLQSIQSLTWDPGPCLPPSHGCCRSPDHHGESGAPGALHDPAMSSAGPAGPRPRGLAREVQEETQGHLQSGPDPCQLRKAASPQIQGVSPSPSTQESFRCEGVSGWTQRRSQRTRDAHVPADHSEPGS